MLHLKMLATAAALLVAPALFAQDKKEEGKLPAAERATASATLDTGSVKIEYGVPSWREEFATQGMKPGQVWRVGNNLPTTIVLEGGLKSDEGAVVPGEYKLALRWVDKSTATLLVYEGTTFYDEGLPTWQIAGKVKDGAPVEQKLKLSFEKANGGTNLLIAFGPYVGTFPMVGVKAHPVVETTFSNVATKIVVTAVPLGEKVKDLRVGTAHVDRDGAVSAYAMYLTIEGDTAKLAFKNVQAMTIPHDKKTLGEIVKGLTAYKEANPDVAWVDQALAMFQKMLNDVVASEEAIARLQPDKVVETKVEKRDTPAPALEFSHERPEGAIIFKFGAKDANASFDIKPREFMRRRQQG